MAELLLHHNVRPDVHCDGFTIFSGDFHTVVKPVEDIQIKFKTLLYSMVNTCE